MNECKYLLKNLKFLRICNSNKFTADDNSDTEGENPLLRLRPSISITANLKQLCRTTPQRL